MSFGVIRSLGVTPCVTPRPSGLWGSAGSGGGMASCGSVDCPAAHGLCAQRAARVVEGWACGPENRKRRVARGFESLPLRSSRRKPARELRTCRIALRHRDSPSVTRSPSGAAQGAARSRRRRHSSRTLCGLARDRRSTATTCRRFESACRGRGTSCRCRLWLDSTRRADEHALARPMRRRGRCGACGTVIERVRDDAWGVVAVRGAG